MFVLVVLLGFSSRQAAAQTKPSAQTLPAGSAASEMEELVQLFHAGLADLHRAYEDLAYTVLPEKKKAYLKEWRDQLQQYPFEQLSQQGKVDYLLLARNIRREEEERLQQQKLWEALQPAMPFASKVRELGVLRHEGKTPDAMKVAGIYEQIGQELVTSRNNLATTNLKVVSSLPQALAMAKSLKKTLKGVFDFYNAYNPSFTWWVGEPYKKTDSLFVQYIDSLQVHLSKHLKSSNGSGIVGAAIGKAQVEQALQSEMIPYKADELIEIAQKEYDWCLKEMKKAAAEMGFKEDWKQALEKVKNDYVPVGEQPAFIRQLADEAVEYLEAHDLITVPALAKQTWTMEMMSPQRQLVNPFFTGGSVISISYPTHTMEYQSRLMSMRGNNRHFAKATVFHELIPGHYLQEYMMERYKPYRKSFYTPFWLEGWAFYWEMLLWDKGFQTSPENRVGALFWRMHRCARIIFSLNFHLGKWTPQQCIDFLIEKVGHERANAEGEVRRSFAGDYGPLYQLAYMIGALQFKALHRELVDSGKMTDKAFHDAIMKQNILPIEMLRALLEDTPLKKDYQSNWKFYREIAHK